PLDRHVRPASRGLRRSPATCPPPGQIRPGSVRGVIGLLSPSVLLLVLASPLGQRSGWRFRVYFAIHRESSHEVLGCNAAYLFQSNSPNISQPPRRLHDISRLVPPAAIRLRGKERTIGLDQYTVERQGRRRFSQIAGFLERQHSRERYVKPEIDCRVCQP